MIGLEFIVKEYHMSFTDIANLLGITRKSVSNWKNGWQPIPKKHLKTLSKYFNVKEEYFQKELSEAEKIEIRISKLRQQKNEENKHIVYLLNNALNNEKLIVQLQEVLNEQPQSYEVLNKVSNIFKNKKDSVIEALEMFLICFDEFYGGHPFASYRNEKLGLEFFEILSKHGLTKGELD
ncbi:helix-turn-helix transcriptional regulator [Heyndrickxia sp. FSL W8-0496]|jgi:transcriptional regulator with XRE-family HTH domain|uniref:helix-turn-helix domain-containing protein n=1 Tax=Heyndrickxia TaxID=2837504 RepID=UPI0030F69960